MKTFNTYYLDKYQLKEFIYKNNITDSASLLIQVFTGNNDKNFIKNLILEIDTLLPLSNLIGTTTDGEIKDGKVTTKHTIISFSAFEKTSLKVGIFDINNAYFDTGKKLATKIVGDKTKAIISFLDGLGGNGEEFLNGIASINKQIKVAGGLAGDNAKFEHTYVFTKQNILKHGAVGVSLNSDSLNIYTDFSFHWSSIGVNLKITKAIQNRVYTINDKSAYDTYSYYLGKDIAQKLPAIGIEFPLIVKKNGMDVARAVTATMDDGSLIFAGNLKSGDNVTFGFADINSILSHSNKHFNNFISKPIETIFIYSCMARRRFMKESINLEIKPFNSIAPTSGFFTYGEFYTSKQSELLNQTMTIFALSEKTDSCQKISTKQEIQNPKINNDTFSALSHLIEVSSTQLQKQNQMQVDVYQELYKIGKGIDETIEENEFFNITSKFVVNKLKFEKCIIFKYDNSNGYFKIKKALGYTKADEKKILKIITLLLSEEITESLKINSKPIIHTKLHPNTKVKNLVKSLFLSEAYFELFGGDTETPYGLIVVGNGFKNLDMYSRIGLDEMVMLALGNFTIQLSNSVNNIIFYKAWENEKSFLKQKIEKRTEELNKQKESFEAIYNSSKDAIAILDIESNFLQVNPAYSDMTGFSKEELLKTSCFTLTAKKDLKAFKKAMAEVLKVGFIRNFERDCIIKNNLNITTNMSMSLLKSPDRILISIRDVTKIRNREKKLRHILNTLVESVIVWMDGKLIDANDRALSMYGCTKEEALGKTPLDFISNEYIDDVLTKFSSNDIEPYQILAKRKDGTTFPAIVNGKNLILNDKMIRVTTVLDITKLKQTQKALEMEKIRAEDAAKAKSEFLANMSHEIRTPMNGIIGMAHLALSSNLNDKQKEYIQKINNSATSLLGIINDILDYSKAEAGKIILEKIDFDLYKLIESIVDILKFKADEKNLDIIIEYEDNLGRYFYGDSLRLKQIITNLLSNAIKFTDKGMIKISVKKVSKDRFRFEIQDTGIGLTKYEQLKLFKSFSQADGSVTRKYGGTGLGLSISKQLVELMDGKIWLESELGKGSKFIFEINLKLTNSILYDENIHNLDYNRNIDTEIADIDKKNISKSDLDKLFLDLKNAVSTKRPKRCEIVIKELDKYFLNDKDKKIFDKIKRYVNSYRFKNAIQLLEERIT